MIPIARGTDFYPGFGAPCNGYRKPDRSAPERGGESVRAKTVPTLVLAALICLAFAIPDHTIFVSAPGDAMEFWRSADGGKTWTQGASPESPSGDTSVNVDQSGAVYESNLNVFTGNQNTLQVDLFKSFDRGTTWPQKGSSAIEDSNASGQPALVDRQWVDPWIPPGQTTNTATVCLTYHDFGPSQMWVSCSFDGGRTFGLRVDAITSPLAQADSYCNTIPGGLKIVQSGPHAGRIYIAWLAADPLNPVTGCNLTQLAAFHSIWSAYF